MTVPDSTGLPVRWVGVPTLPFARYDLPAEAYPFVLEFFRVTDPEATEVVHRIEVSGPGAVRVPGLKGDGPPVWVRMTFSDGARRESWPHGYGRTPAERPAGDR